MIKKLYNKITIIILTLMILVSLALIGPSLLGYKPFVVLSGSMEPSLQVGSMTYVKPSIPENISTGDIITYTMTGNSTKLITHRVVSIDNTKKQFITKGDANNAVDGPVAFERLVGKAVFSIPYLGYAIAYIKTTQGIIVVGSILIIMVFITIIPELIKIKVKKQPKH
jgi:signal peptidase I